MFSGEDMQTRNCQVPETLPALTNHTLWFRAFLCSAVLFKMTFGIDPLSQQQKNCERLLVAAALIITTNWKHSKVHQQESRQTWGVLSLLEKLFHNKKDKLQGWVLKAHKVKETRDKRVHTDRFHLNADKTDKMDLGWEKTEQWLPGVGGVGILTGKRAEKPFSRVFVTVSVLTGLVVT